MEEATASPVSPPASVVQQQQQQHEHEHKRKKSATSAKRDYKGFVAGVFSGIAKLTGKPQSCHIHTKTAPSLLPLSLSHQSPNLLFPFSSTHHLP
jgi:hypothetical protein